MEREKKVEDKPLKRTETNGKTARESGESPGRLTRSRKEIFEKSTRSISTRSGKQINKPAPTMLIEAQPMRTRISGGKSYKTAGDKSDTVSDESRDKQRSNSVHGNTSGVNVSKISAAAIPRKEASRQPVNESASGKTPNNSSVPVSEPSGIFQRTSLVGGISRKQPTDSSKLPGRLPCHHHSAPNLQNTTGISESFIRSIIIRWSPKWFDECGMSMLMLMLLLDID